MKNPEQKADELTDKQLEQLEKKISKMYSDASKDLNESWKNYIKGWNETVDGERIHHAGLQERFRKEYKAYLDGYYTREQFELWYHSQVGRGERWKEMKDQMAHRMTESNQIASGYINNVLPSVYVSNSNAIAEIAKQSAMKNGVAGVLFDLVDERTIKHLVDNKSNTISFRTTSVNPKRDYNWNAGRIQNALLQGILQGDSIEKISKRFLDVMGSNRKAAIRNARTSVTSARNAGKQDRYEELASKGCDVTKIWVATFDDRTRDAHMEADGQEVPYNEPFIVGGEELMCPADPSGSPWNVYNCRCAMRTGEMKFRSILSDEQRQKANIRLK